MTSRQSATIAALPFDIGQFAMSGRIGAERDAWPATPEVRHG